MIKNLTPDMHDKKISCIIRGTIIEDAVIILENNVYYILQDRKDGSAPVTKDRRGYKYSWTIESGSYDAILENNLSQVVFKDPLTEEIY